jgi:hypothetical protein
MINASRTAASSHELVWAGANESAALTCDDENLTDGKIEFADAQ